MSRLKALLLGAMLGGVPALAIPIALHAAADQQVTIDNFAFAPQNLSVSAGTAVTWKNRDDIPHTVTDQARPKEIRSPVLDTDDKYTRRFDAPGRFGYFCSLHAHMQGTVVVR